MVKWHLERIAMVVVAGVSNARANSINARVQRVQWAKYLVRGFGTARRFRNVVYLTSAAFPFYLAAVVRDHLTSHESLKTK